MDMTVVEYGSENHQEEERLSMDLKKGPWTVEEDTLLFNYVQTHGDGRWNSLACHAGLKRTGKSCRLRWLNYLRPSVRRGNITLQEQLLILQLHSRWGNRWSKIAQYLPGRTDNEIKNYWRTRVQKQAKQLKCDVNSQQFQDAMRYVWIPRLVERIKASSESQTGQPVKSYADSECNISNSVVVNDTFATTGCNLFDFYSTPDLSSDTSEAQISSSISDLQTESQDPPSNEIEHNGSNWYKYGGLDAEAKYEESNSLLYTVGEYSLEDSMWSEEDILFLQQQLL